jgi:hypothetical protein
MPVDENQSAALNILLGKTVTRHRSERLKQTQLHVNELTQQISNYLNAEGTFSHDYFYRTFIHPPTRRLWDQQCAMLALINTKAWEHATLGSKDSIIIHAPTASGKSVVIDYFSVIAAGNFVPQAIGSTSHKSYIVACPTIQLCHEITASLTTLWRPWLQAMQGEDPPQKGKVPLVYTQVTRGGGHFPVTPFKEIAGGTGSENLLVELMYGDNGELLDSEARTKKGKQAWLVVATYEHAASILARAATNRLYSWDTMSKTTVLDHIEGVIMDEAHNVEMGREAAWCLHMWIKRRNLWAVYLTGTASATLATTLEAEQHDFFVQRKFPRVFLPFSCFSEVTSLIIHAVSLCFCGWVQSIMTMRSQRTAVFIENKLFLKITLCVLVYKLQTDVKSLFGTDALLDYINDPAYDSLAEALRRDTSLVCDSIAYGKFLDSHYNIPYNVALVWAYRRGIILYTADLSTGVRRRLSVILSSRTVPFTVVIATSALAEGCNMAGLKYVFVPATISSKGKKSILTITKAAQQAGRCDREDEFGMSFIPPVDQCRETDTVIDPLMYFSVMFDYGVTKEDADAVYRYAQRDPEECVVNDVFGVPELTVMFGDEAVVRQLVDVETRLAGWFGIPYYFNNKFTYSPAFYLVHNEALSVDMVKPCFMMRVIKLFARGRSIDMSIFALPHSTVQAIGSIPLVAQLGLVTLFLSAPRNAPFGETGKMQTAAYRKFYEEQELLVKNDDTLRKIYTTLRAVAQIISEYKPDIPSYPNWKLSKSRCAFSAEYQAFAVFITLILNATEKWELICMEWGVHCSVYSSFLQNLDLLVAICQDKSYMPVLELQKKFIVDNCPRVLGVDKARLMSECLDDHDAVMGHSMRAVNRMVCGIDDAGVGRPAYSPYRNISRAVMRRGSGIYLDNELLIVLASAAMHLSKVFNIDSSREYTFSKARTEYLRKRHDDFLDRTVIVIPNDRNTKPPHVRFMTVDPYHRILSTAPNVADDHLTYIATADPFTATRPDDRRQ